MPSSSHYDLNAALDPDYYGVFTDIPEADRAWWRRAREVGERLLPSVDEAWDRGHYPLEWAAELGASGVFNEGRRHDPAVGMSPLAAGLISMELARIDGSLGTVLGVQGSLALRTIALFGSEDQQAAYLDRMADGTLLGSFALTEPDHGSDSVSLETSVRVDGDELIINGVKKWIGNGASGGISVVFCRDEAGDVRAVIVPQDTPGYHGEVIRGKLALRAIHQAEITLDNVRVPRANLLPGVRTFKDVSTVLFATRAGVAWAALGHATALFECALTYAGQREQFGKPLAKFQLVQERLTALQSDLVVLQLMCVRLAELEAAGALKPEQASLAKFTATRTARRMAQTARDMLGGNGILLEHRVARHFADLEALHTYEGTESVQALLVGRDLTGMSAFA